MNDRQRFLATMHYQLRDRAPICDFGFWPKTIEQWHQQGLPDWVTGGHDTAATDRVFGMDRYSGGPDVNCDLFPLFEEKILDDRGDQELVQQADGARVLRPKDGSSIPSHEGHLLVDRASWEKYYKPRLDPTSPERYPQWDPAQLIWQDDDYPVPRTVTGGSLYGRLRDWMGMENISYLVYDDPTLFQQMVETVADLILATHQKAFEHGARFDACGMWEDMCYNGGPLLSPTHFKRYLVPQYRRITDQLRAHGCDIIWVDCDGQIDELIPLWIEGGVNCMFPIEVGTWGADPVTYRKQFGKDLLLMGGFDKHILAHSPRAIEQEVDRLTPLVEQGGYIPFCDHRVPPDVPLANYLVYLRCARARWGKGTNLKPMLIDRETPARANGQ